VFSWKWKSIKWYIGCDLDIPFSFAFDKGKIGIINMINVHGNIEIFPVLSPLIILMCVYLSIASIFKSELSGL